jgi:hypothetical protein
MRENTEGVKPIPKMERVKLSDIEIEMLRSEIQEKKSSFTKMIFISIILSIFFVFFSGRGNEPSFFQKYGFWIPAIVFNAMFLGYTFYLRQQEIALINLDINSEKKTQEGKIILKKDRSFSTKKCLIYIDSDTKEFNHFEVNEKEFDAIEKGHKVVLEYAQHSKYLFRLDLKLG